MSGWTYWRGGFFSAAVLLPLAHLINRTPPAGVSRPEYVAWEIANALGGLALWLMTELLVYLWTHYRITRRTGGPA